MKRSTLIGSVAACLCVGLAVPLFAAEPAVTGAATAPSPNEKDLAAAKPAETCLKDLHAFDDQMEKDGFGLSGTGYGLSGSGYGYAYPMGDYPAETGYRNARPAYEVRNLVSSAAILARHGQQQSCEDVLATTRNIYKLYVTNIHDGGVPMVDAPRWRQQQIAGAQPVTSGSTTFRSDELLGTEVRDPKDQALGSVDDLVMSPQTGKIAYLVISRGGFLGIDEKYVPVPWEDFKVTANLKLLVLDATKGDMDAAPQVSYEQLATTTGHFDQQSPKVDAYWKVHLHN